MSSAVIGALAPAGKTLRLSIHILAATIWVGGQLTVAGLLPAVRKLGIDAPKSVARAFARIEWPAFVILILTGVWNISAAGHQSSTWSAVLGAKIAIVAVAGVAIIAHTRSKTKAGVAAYGALAATCSLVAVVLGVALAG
jgi:uncharacterized membrane protein